MAGSPVIVAEQLTKKYGDHTAVDHVSFKVSEGEVFSLLGPNGAGKTTTVEMLECLRTPTSGDAYIKGLSIRNMADVKQIKKLIGVLPQEFNAVANLTVAENVRLAAAARGARDVEQILDDLGLREYRGRLFSRLSGGLKRRVGLAMALVGEPEIVFLDEPTTGLDPEARRETWLYVKRLKAYGKTVVLTTHYMEEAETLSDHVVIIVKGRIAAQGKVRELVAKHGGRTKLVFEGLDEKVLASLKNKGFEAEQTPEGRTVVRISNDSEIVEVLSSLRAFSIEVYPEIRQAGLEDVFLSVIGSRLSEEGLLV
ncbi:MAG: ABC transporter ATP-binding protein [Candidatus Caldarchaeum sp.]